MPLIRRDVDGRLLAFVDGGVVATARPDRPAGVWTVRAGTTVRRTFRRRSARRMLGRLTRNT